MKLIHKGLILISVPLAFEVFFVAGFGSLLKRSMQQLEAEVHAKKVIAYAERLECALSEASFNAALNSLRKDPVVDRRYQQIWRDITQNYFALEKIADSNDQMRAMADIKKSLISIRRFQEYFWISGQGTRELLPGAGLGQVPATVLAWFVQGHDETSPIATLIQRELQSVGQGPKLHAEIATQFRNFVLFGVLADVLLVIGLSLFFGKSIEQRLRSLLDTTFRLAKGTDLAPPLKGNDELAQLDLLLHDTAARLIEVERFKKQLVGVVCRELKAPLRTVGDLLSLVAAEANAISDDAQQCIRLAERNCERLQTMVQELLDLEVMSSGKVTLNRASSHSGEIMENAADMVRAMASHYNIELVLKDCRADACLDADRMIQVLVNLLSNAIKFSPEGGQVVLESNDAGSYLEFRVSDKGPGIPEELHESIFEVFRQAEQPQTNKIKGTGMGLSIAKTIVESHGGTIRIQSSPGQGCTFLILVPKNGSSVCQDAVDAQATLPKMKTRSVARSMRIRHKGMVLIGLPLLTEILLVGALIAFLHQAGNEIRSQSLSRTITAESRKVVEYAANSSILVLMGLGRQDVIDLYKIEDQKLTDKIDELKSTCTGDAIRESTVRSIESTISSIRQIQEGLIAESATHKVTLSNAGSKRVQSYLDCWQLLSDQVTKLAVNEERLATDANLTLATLAKYLDLVLLIGLAVNLLSAIGLAFFLIQNITKRISNVKQNAERMLTREPLLAPIHGSDEITLLDRAFRDAAGALNREQELKQQLVATVSHELRTPLTSICAGLGLLSCGAMGELPAQAVERIEQAESATERLIALINDILDIEKMDAGNFVLELEDVPAQVIAARAAACVEQMANAKYITVENTVESATIRGDADRLVQVLVNLLSMTMKFSPDNQVVRVGSYRNAENLLVITINDCGDEMPNQIEERIFETFTAVSGTESSHTGTGLGLPISKAIVEQHGGSIGVQSIEGRKTTFWFSIPLAHEKDPDQKLK